MPSPNFDSPLYRANNSAATLFKKEPQVAKDYVTKVLARNDVSAAEAISDGRMPLEVPLDTYLHSKMSQSGVNQVRAMIDGIGTALLSAPSLVATVCNRTRNDTALNRLLGGPLTTDDLDFFKTETVDGQPVSRADILTDAIITMAHSKKGREQMRNASRTDSATYESGSFSPRQLSTVSPIINITNIRGIAYPILPMMAIGAQSNTFQRNAYSTQGGFEEIVENQTTDFPVIEGVAKSDTVSISSRGLAIKISIEEVIAMAAGIKERGYPMRSSPNLLNYP